MIVIPLFIFNFLLLINEFLWIYIFNGPNGVATNPPHKTDGLMRKHKAYDSKIFFIALNLNKKLKRSHKSRELQKSPRDITLSG
jgi:hypothetical protein